MPLKPEKGISAKTARVSQESRVLALNVRAVSPSISPPCQICQSQHREVDVRMQSVM